MSVIKDIPLCIDGFEFIMNLPESDFDSLEIEGRLYKSVPRPTHEYCVRELEEMGIWGIYRDCWQKYLGY